MSISKQVDRRVIWYSIIEIEQKSFLEPATAFERPHPDLKDLKPAAKIVSTVITAWDGKAYHGTRLA